MYNRYQGNTGRVERVEDARAPDAAAAPAASRPAARPSPGERRPPGPLSGLSGELGRLLGRLRPARMETEDYLLLVILYLLYRESGDTDFLYAVIGYLLL